MRRSPRFLTPAIFGATAVFGAAATFGVASIAHAADATAPGGVVVSAPALSSAQAILTRADCEAAVARLQATSTSVRAMWRLGQTAPSLLTGLKIATVGDSVTARALQFVATHPALIGVDAKDLQAGTVRSTKNRDVVVLEQMHAGQRVWQRTVAITLDHTGTVLSVSNDTRAIATVDAATITVDQARAIALAGSSGNSGGKEAERVVVVGTAGAFEAATFFVAPAGTLNVNEVVVNLHDGTIASTQTAIRR